MEGKRGESINRYASRELFEQIGLSERSLVVAQVAARLGGRRLLEFHGVAPEVLQTKLKADAGMTPVTAADLASEEIILRILQRDQRLHSPGAKVAINAE